MIMKTTYIYWLRDPRNQSIFYVGKTNNPVRREYEHGSTRKDHPDYLKELLASKHKPVLEIVEIVGGGGWREERRWLLKLKEFGHPICNMPRAIGGTSVNDCVTVYRKPKWKIREEQGQRIRARWRKWYDSLTQEQKSEYQRKKLDNGGKERMIAAQKGRVLDREFVEQRAVLVKEALASPSAKEKMSTRTHNFWASMDKEQRKEFVASRWKKAVESGKTGFITVKK